MGPRLAWAWPDRDNECLRVGEPGGVTCRTALCIVNAEWDPFMDDGHAFWKGYVSVQALGSFATLSYSAILPVL